MMRKASAFVLATFYLLLSTGAFACIVHCTSKIFFSSNNEISQNTSDRCDDKKRPDSLYLSSFNHKQSADTSHRHKKDDCGPGKNCDCCKKHGMYVVRENVQTSWQNNLIELVAALPPVTVKQTEFKSVPVLLHDYPRATGPPVVNYLPIYLKVRSLLI
ncbi:hypothetical protein AB6735_03215 [Mucilaginibacter sp. RCC_168]|uniref:hypothetical protein n=1 Tax=Mucilaginibacter sp. RCC_168 TaxID=3239221 RepID=UPI00352423AC